MKKSALLFLLIMLMLLVQAPVNVVALDNDGPTGEGLYNTFKKAAEEQQQQQSEEAAEAMSGFGAAGNAMPKVPATFNLHVPVQASNLPPEITRVGVRCTVRSRGEGRVGEHITPVRGGERRTTIIVPVSLRINPLQNFNGSYRCSLLLQKGDGGPIISEGQIRQTVELDPAVPVSDQVFIVRGNINRPVGW